jgi:hypothetical protein
VAAEKPQFMPLYMLYGCIDKDQCGVLWMRIFASVSRRTAHLELGTQENSLLEARSSTIPRSNDKQAPGQAARHGNGAVRPICAVSGSLFLMMRLMDACGSS